MSTIKKTLTALCSLSLVSSIALFGAANAAEENSNVKVLLSKPKLSKSFKELAKPLPVLNRARVNKMLQSGEKVPGIDKVEPVPNRGYPFAEDYLNKNSGNTNDPVLQTSQTAPSLREAKVPATVGLGFDGMGNLTGAVPPDTNADVGPNHIVQTVNTAISIWDKAGNELLPPVAINSLWSGFGGLCESTNRGDPIVLYDSQADRWLISQFAFNGGMTDNRNCIAISQTGDPTGAYHLYDFFYSATKFNDYPHYGVWTDGYYAGVNQFSGSPLTFAGSGVVAFERDKMLLGQPAQQVIIDLETSQPNAFTPMPADIDGIFLPPAGMAAPFVTADNVNEMNIWKFTVDWATPANSTFELATAVAVAPYNGGVCGFSRDCVAQPNTQRLDAIGQRMMFRAAYRNIGGVNKLVANHTVVGSTTDNNIAGVRWYEFDLAADGSATLANNGTFNPDDGNSRWMGSAAMDAVGNIGVAYSVSGPSLAPSIRFSGRSPADAPNVLTLAEQDLKVGEGSQQNSNRWGDYSSLSVDPTDDCTFWYTTEYYKTANDNSTGWQTFIGSFKFVDCVAGPAGKIAGVVTNSADSQPIINAQVTIGALTVITNENGEYSATLPVDTGYNVSFSKYGWITGSASSLDVAEDQTTTQDIALDPAAAVTVTGTVRDGSGLGGNLLAEVVVNAPGTTITTFTDPVTGQYSLDLFAGTLVKVTASAVPTGYMPLAVDILPENTPVQDFDLVVTSSCIADGYEFSFPAFSERFDSGVPPTGWTVEDISGNGILWQTASTTARPEILGSDEAAAIDSDAGGFSETHSTLTSPLINVADIETTTLTFASLFRTFGGGDVYNLEINVDSAGWVTAYAFVATDVVENVSVDLSTQLAGATSFQIRFNYQATFEFYAYIDDVQFGQAVCIASAGTIVKGSVIDANTSLELNGASIVAGQESVVTGVTESADIVDGYFSIFVADTETEVTVSLGNYAPQTVAVADINFVTPIALEAGQLSVDADLPAVDVTNGREGTTTVTISNTGNIDADAIFLLTMLPPTPANKVNGPFHPSSRHFGPKSLADLTTKKIRHKMEAPYVPESTAEFVGGFSVEDEVTFGWGIGVNQDNGTFWVGDLLAGGAPIDSLYQYDSTGAFTGNVIDNTSISAVFAADMAYNNRTGMFWQVQVTGDDCIHEVDPVNMTITGETICPAFGNPQRGLAYDPLTNTFYSGSWVDSIIHQFTTDGEILRSVNVGLSVSGLALNPLTNSLYVMSNAVSPVFDITVLDAGTATLVPVSGINFPLNIDFTGDGVADDLLPDNEQSGLGIDCAGNLWTPVRPFRAVLGIRSGETNVCEWKELSWLKFANGNTAKVVANGTADIELDFTTTELPVGTYSAQIITAGNTPYADSESMVTLNVTEPNFGQVGFSVSAASAANGASATVTVARTGGSDFAVSVDYQTANGTAVSGTNYQDASGTLTWADGDTAAKTITVQTTNTKQTQDLGLSVVLSNAVGGATVSESEASVIILRDKKGGGSFGFGVLILLGLAGLARRRRYS